MALKYAKQTELQMKAHFSIGSFIAIRNICIKYRIHAESDFVVVVMKTTNEFDGKLKSLNEYLEGISGIF